ncbi:apoptosis facilitator Bcl-2-like protein 14 [Mastacembelus armatus]|uniref:apoptosis facilitator Bcl-2-like protein 14 n=1 Tax=Mastacembelus armatus TaxID=205130 RepID=UPI000E4572C3|nr:apoptosis facilitator Bcl-2-like protein 14 [Mastacembelus armatus]
MASSSEVGESEVFLLLQDYCSKRPWKKPAKQRSRKRSWKRSWKKPSRTDEKFRQEGDEVVEFQAGASRPHRQHSPGRLFHPEDDSHNVSPRPGVSAFWSGKFEDDWPRVTLGRGVIRPQSGGGILRMKGLTIEAQGPAISKNESGNRGDDWHEGNLGHGVTQFQSGGGFRTVVQRLIRKVHNLEISKERSDASPATSRSAVTDRMVQISESAPIPEVDVGEQDEIVQKLMKLLMKSGDDMNAKIEENQALQQQLSNLNYKMFAKLMSTLQNVVQRGRLGSEQQTEQQKIVWAFEVTSRLSALGVTQRRRVLGFGERYIQQHHGAWVEQHGGWEKAFEVD